MFLAALGDGSIVRSLLDAVVDFLRRFAAPTGARGSLLLMWGGLIILGFLFLTFLFRSAIVGDLAPVANGRTPVPRVLLPGRASPSGASAAPPPARAGFAWGRREGRNLGATLDEALEGLRVQGIDARILTTHVDDKRIRLYRCASCASARRDCEAERGLLAGAFERVTGQVAKVDEVVCARAGAPYCEFLVRHAPLVRAT